MRIGKYNVCPNSPILQNRRNFSQRIMRGYQRKSKKLKRTDSEIFKFYQRFERAALGRTWLRNFECLFGNF